jgi:hypothetical protein
MVSFARWPLLALLEAYCIMVAGGCRPISAMSSGVRLMYYAESDILSCRGWLATALASG